MERRMCHLFILFLQHVAIVFLFQFELKLLDWNWKLVAINFRFQDNTKEDEIVSLKGKRFAIWRIEFLSTYSGLERRKEVEFQSMTSRFGFPLFILFIIYWFLTLNLGHPKLKSPCVKHLYVKLDNWRL
jgi:hypothetical protein